MSPVQRLPASNVRSPSTYRNPPPSWLPVKLYEPDLFCCTPSSSRYVTSDIGLGGMLACGVPSQAQYADGDMPNRIHGPAGKPVWSSAVGGAPSYEPPPEVDTVVELQPPIASPLPTRYDASLPPAGMPMSWS